MRKDLGLAVDMATGTGAHYPGLAAVKALVDSVGEETFQNWRRVAGLQTAEPGISPS